MNNRHSKGKESLKVKISLSGIKIPNKSTKTRTIKKGRSKYLNIYKKHNGDLSNISLDKEIFETLADVERYGYEPSYDMYSLDPELVDCVEEMTLHLYILITEFERLKNMERVYIKEDDPKLKLLAEQKHKKCQKEFKTETKDRGKSFMNPFNKMYNTYKNKKILMIIFVEVIKCLMKREKKGLKLYSEREIKKLRDLMHGMVVTQGFHQHDEFFVHLKHFYELFRNVYSTSLTRCLASPALSSPSGPSPSPATSFANDKRIVYSGCTSSVGQDD